MSLTRTVTNNTVPMESAGNGNAEIHHQTAVPRSRFSGFGLLPALLVGIIVALMAAGSAAAEESGVDVDFGVAGDKLAQSQILNGDLTVESGETIESDVSVYSGDVKIETGARVDGSLLVYSGDVEIEEGGIVDGDVTAFSGDVEVAGEVRGDVASWSGDVRLDETAVVAGDVSVLSGDIKRDDGATVGGNLVRGPTLNFAVPGFGSDFQFDGNPAGPRQLDEFDVGRGPLTLWDRIGRFFLRLVLGGVLALLFTGLASVLVYAKPGYVAEVGRTIQEQTAASFVVGLVTSLVLAFLAICGIPLLILIALSFVGWAAFALLLGERIARTSGADWTPVVAAMVGAIVLSILLVPLWSLGGCFRFIVSVGTFLAGSVGVGAVVLPWLNRARGSDSPPPQIRTESASPTPSPTAPADQASPAANRMPDEVAAGQIPVDDSFRPVEPAEDDFTQIDGIGQIFDARLKVAGIRTFEQLAALSSGEIAALIEWPVEQVELIGVAEQAAGFAGEASA